MVPSWRLLEQQEQLEICNHFTFILLNHEINYLNFVEHAVTTTGLLSNFQYLNWFLIICSTPVRCWTKWSVINTDGFRSLIDTNSKMLQNVLYLNFVENCVILLNHHQIIRILASFCCVWLLRCTHNQNLANYLKIIDVENANLTNISFELYGKLGNYCQSNNFPE